MVTERERERQRERERKEQKKGGRQRRVLLEIKSSNNENNHDKQLSNFLRLLDLITPSSLSHPLIFFPLEHCLEHAPLFRCL